MSDTLSTISAEDVWALRNADNVTFHTYSGRSYINAYLRDYGHRVYSVKEQTVFAAKHDGTSERYREIPVALYRCEDYGTDRRTGDIAGFATHPHDTWKTIADALRKDDALGFTWIRSNNSQAVTAAGFVRDELRMTASDPDRKRNRTWLIAVQCGPDNSARMVQRSV